MQGPHRIEETIAAGAPLESAKAALILVHGRGATAESMLPLAEALSLGIGEFAYLAPQATANTWYPYPFTAPIEANEPWLSSALSLIAALVSELSERGLPPERVGILGFSQGACLTSEFAARNARRYGFLAVLTGGLIGPPGTPRDYPGSLDGTPVFLGCSDIDAHIPLERVEETAEVLTRLGGVVDKRIYLGMDHTVDDDEIAAVKALLARLTESDSKKSPIEGDRI
jgi:predicted esterase